MKKLALLFISTLFLSFFSSCTSSDEKYDKNDESGWVQFENGNTIEFLFQPGAVYRIPVKLFSPVNVTGLSVDYSLTNVVGSTDGIVQVGSPVQFVSNSNTGGEVVLNVISSSLSQNIEFDVTLTSTSRGNVRIGLGNNEKPIKKRIKICSPSIASNYTGASTRVGGNTFSPWSPVITPVVGEPNKYELNTCWGTGFVQFLAPTAPAGFNYPGIITINSDNTVMVEGINTPTFPNRYPGGTGTFNPCTKEIRYTLNQGLFTNPFQVAVVLTAN